MADKAECPACESWTSAIATAVRNGEPCPYCGLDPEVREAVLKARKSGVEKKFIDRLLVLEKRNTELETTLNELRQAWNSIREVMKRIDELALAKPELIDG